MTATSTTFDTLGIARRLEQAGFTREQAEAQAEVWKEQGEALQKFFSRQEADSRKQLATKGDVADVRLEIEKVRAELKTDIESLKYALLKWQLGIGLAIVLIMAKGFGWLGF